MRKWAAAAWLLVCLAATAHLAATMAESGLPLQTDLAALMPAEDRDPLIHRVKERVGRDVSSRVLILAGHADKAQAAGAADDIAARLTESGVWSADPIPDAERFKALGAAYFPHRSALLSAADRELLRRGQGEILAQRALAQFFAFGGAADSRMAAADPLGLTAAYMTALPLPGAQVQMIDGKPGVTADGKTWMLISGRLRGAALSLNDQKAFAAAWSEAASSAVSTRPGLVFLRLGAVFYAQAGAERGLSESSRIGAASLIGTLALFLWAFRRGAPLLLGAGAVACGMICALSAAVLMFGGLHVIALVFGAGLIGVSVDYALHYFTRIYAGEAPGKRLDHILPGLCLGLLTSVIGYAALAAAPLPGLRQVAVFSAIGLIAAFLTTILWFPLLDRTPVRPMPGALKQAVAALSGFWSGSARRRNWVGAVFVGLLALGAAMLRTDDDWRNQQDLDPALLAEQTALSRLTGIKTDGRFYVVRAADDDAALRSTEALGERLSQAGIAWRAPAAYIPSTQRQTDDAELIKIGLIDPYFPVVGDALGLTDSPYSAPAAPLTPDQVLAARSLPFLSSMIIEPGIHLVQVSGGDGAVLADMAQGLDGIDFVDPAGDSGRLLAGYRSRALWLLALSAAAMVPVLALRYGFQGALAAAAPPVAAVAAVGPILALLGVEFSFFTAMALILVLSVGVDYAVFCAESAAEDFPVSLAAAILASTTTLLSFGLLAFSDTNAVHSFGAACCVGLALSILAAPFAARATPRRKAWPKPPNSV